ncbi:MAG: flavodoxin domain-containing protein [Candidatus Atabeyarchaeum deiterrae]
MKGIIVYDSKYGNTKIVAEKISEGLRTVRGIQVELEKVQDVEINNMPKYDLIVIGSPNHMGGPSRPIRKFIDKLSELDLKNKVTAAFDTYIGKDFQKTAKKIEEKLTRVVGKLKLMSLSLSIRVKGMKGPIDEDEIDKCVEFGRKLGEKILQP